MMDTKSRLIYMVNQIARNFEATGHDHAIAATTDHLLAFWDPRMKAQITSLTDAEAATLGPIGAAAVAGLAAGWAPAPQTRATVFNAVDEPGRSDAG